ncbi:MAG TPA: YIP1 family protein [Pyrinomonadaceae bacterium]|jgi:hypothetical protein|nr:YIP1 family protein [Pyrinomonadaceae bacterium]
MSDTNITTPPPTAPAAAATPGGPTMSTPETLSSIFFEPGATFEALRNRPRFLAAALIMVALTTLVVVLLFQRIDYAKAMREALDKNPRTEQMTPQQKEQAVAFQTGPIGKALVYASPLIATVFILAAGAALYLLGSMLMGGSMSYKQALSVWTYSSLPPAVLATLVSIVTMFVKSPDDIDLQKSGGGLLQANLGVLLSSDASPVLRALLGSFDLFAFYGLFLAAIGLRKVARLSSGAAWTIALGLWIIGVLAKVGWAAAFGG